MLEKKKLSLLCTHAKPFSWYLNKFVMALLHIDGNWDSTMN